MQNGQLWPSIWHHLRHPLVAELRRWGWRNSSTPLDTLSNNEGDPKPLIYPTTWLDSVFPKGLVWTMMGSMDFYHFKLTMLCLPRCSRWHWLDPRICSDLFLQLPANTLPGTILFHTVDRLDFFSRSADAFSSGNQTVDFLTIQFLCLFLNYFFPDKSALKLTLLALFPAAALAPTLSWAALGTKCLGTREDGRGLRESLPDTTIFLGEKHGKNAEKTWYMHGLRQIFPWVFPVT